MLNGILNNKLSADPEEVRSIVQEKGYYDPANFAANFKSPKYSKYFSKPLESQGDTQTLSKQGEETLAQLIKSLVS